MRACVVSCVCASEPGGDTRVKQQNRDIISVSACVHSRQPRTYVTGAYNTRMVVRHKMIALWLTTRPPGKDGPVRVTSTGTIRCFWIILWRTTTTMVLCVPMTPFSCVEIGRHGDGKMGRVCLPVCLQEVVWVAVWLLVCVRVCVSACLCVCVRMRTSIRVPFRRKPWLEVMLSALMYVCAFV